MAEHPGSLFTNNTQKLIYPDNAFHSFLQDLLYRRARALADYENSNKTLDKARLKGKDIAQAEENQKQCLRKFDKLSESGKKGVV